MTDPPIRSQEELEEARLEAIENFRTERMEEPLEDYLEAFDEYLGITEELLESTVDLTELEAQAVGIVTNDKLQEALRYVAGPPVSKDDLKTLSDVSSLAESTLRKDPAQIRSIVQTVLIGLDRRRFPWVLEGRDPTEAERTAAVLATAALLATRKVGTKRRNLSKKEQEDKVAIALASAHMTEVPTHPIATIADAPRPGEFCRESNLGTRKADFVVGLYDRRLLALECKVSNSATNSVKRLNNDAAVKAEIWRDEFGARNVVPAAVLSGVYKLRNLRQAQDRGLAIFWSHRLPELIQWIDATKTAPTAKVAERRASGRDRNP